MAQQENAPNKPVHLMYLVGVVVLFYLLQWGIDWIWGYFGPSPSDFKLSIVSAVIATVVGVTMYRSDKYYHLANEVSSELKKVTWPTYKEVINSSIIVVVCVLFLMVFLAGSDWFLARIMQRVLFGVG